MAILYACDTCQDTQPAHSSEARDQWEAPEGWLVFTIIHRVADEEHNGHAHFCSQACLLRYLNAHAGEMREWRVEDA